MSIKTDIPKLYSGFFDPLTAQGSKDSFHKRYKHFKKRCHCQTLKQIVNVSSEHLDKVEDVEELKKVLEGLRVVREKYPTCSRWKQIFKKFNSQFRKTQEANIQSLDSTIIAYVKRIESLSNMPPQGADQSLSSALNDKSLKIAVTQDSAYNNVKLLLDTPKFCTLAQATVKRMVQVSSLPANEVIEIWGAEMGALVEVCPKTFSAADVHLAMLLAAKEDTPKLIQRMEKLRDQDPGVVFPLISKQKLEGAASVFRHLATSVNLALGEDKAAELDLLSERYGNSQDDVFVHKTIPEDVKQLLEDRPDLMPDIRLLIVKMGADLSESSPEAALENLKNGVYALFERENQMPLDEKGGMRMTVRSIQSNELDLLVKALVVRMAQDQTEDIFPSFALVFETCLKQSGKLDKGTQSIVNLFAKAYQEYAEVDLTSKEAGKTETPSLEGKDVQSLKPDIIGWDLLENHMTLGHQNASNDLNLRGESHDFMGKVEEISKLWRFQLGMENYSKLDLNGVFNIIEGRSIDEMDFENIQLIMYAIYDKDSEIFSSIVHKLITMVPKVQEAMGKNYVKLCHAVDFVTGIDPRNVRVEDNRLIFEQPIRKEIDPEKLKANIRISTEQYRWLANFDENQPPEGIPGHYIRDAKNILRLLENEGFKREVEEIFSNYCDLGPPLGTHAKRRYLNAMQNNITAHFGRVFDPTKDKFFADDFLPFMQAVIAVNPEKAREFLVQLGQEDESILECVKSNDDWSSYSIYNLIGYYTDQDKFLIPAYKEVSASIVVNADNVGTDVQDLNKEENK